MSRRLTTQKRIDAVSILEFNHVLNAVIDLAEVPASAHDCFIQQIKLALAEAHRICEINREELATAKDAKALLEEIAANTNDLSMRLQKLDSSSGDLSNFDLARRYIEIAISAKFPESIFHLPRSFRYVSMKDTANTLSKLGRVVADAILLFQQDTKTKGGRPRGATGYPGLYEVATIIFHACKAAGGKFEIKNSRLGVRKGNFLEAVKLLRPYMPPQFVPLSDTHLGNVLYNVVQGISKNV